MEKIPPLFTASGAAYLRQMHEAGKFEARLIEKLKSDGWTYEPETGLWRHPSNPGYTIER